MTNWTSEDDLLANASGWGIFDNSDYGIEIERIDDPEEGGPVFDSDEAAVQHVEEAAAAGDILAIKALVFVAESRR